MMLQLIRFMLVLTSPFGIFYAFADTVPDVPDDRCRCDTAAVSRIIGAEKFNALADYDSPGFPLDSFYALPPEENRVLWYRDVENPDTTRFTRYWNAYSEANYQADHLDFVRFYRARPDIELAFQFGPNLDLWAYHIFVIRKIDCCYLITRSYFRHARFTYKAWALLDERDVDSLYGILAGIGTSPVDTVADYRYQGYFADNRNDTAFFIDFDGAEEGGAQSVKMDELFRFVDKSVPWRVTYR